MPERPSVSPAVVGGIRFQRAAVDLPSLRSPLYAALLDATLANVEAGGPCAEVLSQVPAHLDAIDDAVILRFLGGMHRLVLGGLAPDLARWFATAGGSFDPATDVDAAGRSFVAAVEAHAGAAIEGLEVPVQTNEVARCAALVVGFTAALREHGLPLRILELGASAGLNLRWDRWRYESGTTSWGEADAALTFRSNYRSPEPDVTAPLGRADAVAERRGCDRSPVDPATPEGAMLLRSFVWPDQSDRHRRLDAALDAAAALPVPVEAADAATWVVDRLAEPAPGTTTVVYHSVVWQYLPGPTRDAIAAALEAAGGAAADDAPVAWLRMEAGPVVSEAAEVRLRTWPGDSDRLLAHTGFHGDPVSAVS